MQYRRLFKKATVDRLEHRRDLQDKKKFKFTENLHSFKFTENGLAAHC